MNVHQLIGQAGYFTTSTIKLFTRYFNNSVFILLLKVENSYCIIYVKNGTIIIHLKSCKDKLVFFSTEGLKFAKI